MLHTDPDFSGGIIREKEGVRFFLRLWPSPIFLQESAAGIWSEVDDIDDDFNLLTLVDLRDRLAEKDRCTYPQEVDFILNKSTFIKKGTLPETLQILCCVQNRIINRKKMMRVIPTALFRLVRRFPERHFSLLQYFHENPGGIEMAQTNPALVYMLATSKIWCKKNNIGIIGSPRKIQDMKRVDILKSLGFTGADKSIIRLLKKIDPWGCRIEYIWGLLKILEDWKIKRRLRHLPRINFGCVAILGDLPLFHQVSNSLLHEVAENFREDKHPVTAQKLKAWLKIEEEQGNSKPTRIFSSCTRLDRTLFSDSWLPFAGEMMHLFCPLPKSPLPDHPDIRSLRNSKEVGEEGEEQGNCVLSLLPEFLAGKKVIYRVLAPERATLTLYKKDEKWQIDALESSWNQPVSSKTRDYVQGWLDRKNQVNPG